MKIINVVCSSRIYIRGKLQEMFELSSADRKGDMVLYFRDIK